MKLGWLAGHFGRAVKMSGDEQASHLMWSERVCHFVLKLPVFILFAFHPSDAQHSYPRAIDRQQNCYSHFTKKDCLSSHFLLCVMLMLIETWNVPHSQKAH